MIQDENEAYHRDMTRISKSKLDVIAKSPLHFWAKFLDPNRKPEPPTAWGVTGNAVHTAILEPHKFDRRYTVVPANAPKKPTAVQLNAKNPSADTIAAIEWWASFNAANAGKSILTAEEYEEARGMQDAVLSHPSAAALLVSEDLKVEETLEFTEPHTGVNCKMRRDAFNTRLGWTLDLKTTESAHPEDFAKSVHKYRYHVQDAFYSDGHMAVHNEYPEAFIFIAVEKKYPHAVACYQLSDAAVNLGRELYMRDLDTYLHCMRTGIWKGYSDDIERLELPKWAYKV
jgi:exodeoxyribonuclease VIII